MKRMTALALLTFLAMIAEPCAAATKPAPAFSKVDWEQKVAEAWNRQDAKLFSDCLSKLYNDAGVSKEEAVKQATEIFKQCAKIVCRYRVLWFKQFPDPTMASVKIVMEIQGVPRGGNDLVVIRQTQGYHALIFEDGQWRLYGIMFFVDPRVPNFNFDKERGNWPRFDTQIQLADYHPDAAPAMVEQGWQTATTVEKDTQRFDKSEWETRIAEGWNRKDAVLVLSCFSKFYNEVGVSRDEAVSPVSGFFQKFDKLICRYRVLAFRQLPGTNLASIKAVMELSGIPVGSNQVVTFIQTMGYASLIFEDGQWKMYCSQLFYSPKVPRFNFTEEKGNWPAWGTVVDLASQ
jgi:hypothetical protein